MHYGFHNTDKELRIACIAGNRRAQQVLYQKYFGQFKGIPMRYMKNKEEATSLLNQAFLNIFNSLPNYKEEGSFIGWMSTIVFRTTMDKIRSNKRYNERFILQTPRENARPVSNNAESKLNTEHIYHQIQQLPDHLRVVFNLYVIEGYKHEEVAQEIDIKLSTSKWRLAKAREILQKALQKHYPNEKSA